MAMTALDYEEIRQLLARYNFALDFSDSAAWAACFTPTGSFETIGVPADSYIAGPFVGHDQLVAAADRVHAENPRLLRHWTLNLVIDGDGERASMRSYLASSQGKPVLNAAGTYNDELVKLDGKWLFAARHFQVDPPA